MHLHARRLSGGAMGKKSRRKGAAGEREFAQITDGERTWWAPHDVNAYGRDWEIKRLKTGFAAAYAALEEFEQHEQKLGGDQAPIVGARQDHKEWLVIQYLKDYQIHEDDCECSCPQPHNRRKD